MKFFRALRQMVRGKRWQREWEEELALHREMKRRELQRTGFEGKELDAAVRQELGNETLMKEEARALWLPMQVEGVVQDLRVALRHLWQARGFALTVTAILALGIGLNAAVFTLLSAVALRPLPVKDPERLVYVMEQHVSGCCSPPSWLDQRDIRQQQRAFSSLAAFHYDPNFLIGVGGETRHFHGGYVTPDYFSTLGVQPVRGRLFTKAEGQPGHDNAVLLREDFWQSEFGGDTDILRKTVRVNGMPCNVIGVLPASFRFPSEDAVVWTPLVPTTLQRAERGWHGFPMVGRIKAGVTREAALTDLKAIMARLSHQYAEDKDRTGAIIPFATWGMEDARARLMVLQGVALAVFLMTCANVSSLLLARYSSRRREFAVCAALGASRWRLVRKHLSEALLLAVGGCGAGVMVAWVSVKLLLVLYQDRLPRMAEVAVDWRLIAFMAGITVAGAAALGLVTALQENNRALERSLRESGRGSTGRRGARLRQLLVAAQMAGAVALLAASGELMESFWNLLQVGTGIRSAGVETMRVDIPETKYKTPGESARFYEELTARVGSVPGVNSAASINMLPLAEWGNNSDVEVAGLPLHAATFFAENRWITGDYFGVMGIPFVRGRRFAEAEMAGKRKAVIVNETMARALWKDKDPLGYSMRGFANSSDWFTVVGVVRDVRQASVDQPARAELYAPLDTWGEPVNSQEVVLRSRLNGAELQTAIRREVAALDSGAAMYRFKSMDEVIRDSMAGYRITATLLVVFAGLALLLAAFGIYGVIAYSVSERRRELAIRAALGARPAVLVGMMTRQCLVMVGVGVVSGAMGTLSLSRLMRSVLFGVKSGDVTALVVAVAILLGVATLASVIPAAGASRVDPMLPLREE